jgi:hypothetical protein
VEFVFIVSRTAPQTYRYLMHVFADDTTCVVFDRRAGERRRSQGTPRIERRRGERRHRAITAELELRGWELVRLH